MPSYDHKSLSAIFAFNLYNIFKLEVKFVLADVIHGPSNYKAFIIHADIHHTILNPTAIIYKK